MATGYSGKPLYQKLGIKPGHLVVPVNAPNDYKKLVEYESSDIVINPRARSQADIAHVFVTSRAELKKKLPGLMKVIKPDGTIWVSWPKKASKVATDMTEDAVRDVALPLGLVDVKVCAVDETWSGLKLVARVENRAHLAR